MDARLHNRLNSHVALPARDLLSLKDIFCEIKVGPDVLPINIELLRQHFWSEGRISLEAASEIVLQATALLGEESNVVELNAPLTLFGDIHGQYFDLVHTIKKIDPPRTNDPWLFLGDYVDRGSFSCEVVLFLFAMKICYPTGVFLLRGNHECRHLGNHYSFKKECLAKYKSPELFEAINVAFDNLPLAALIEAGNNHRFFALHGGLSPDILTIDDVRDLDRKKEPPHKGAVCDILWSDPLEDETGNGLDEDTMQEWYAVDFEPNPTRGCGYVFGYKATIDFLERNRLTSLIRAHDVKREGYSEHHMHCKTGRHLPLVVTIFSAPNYCGYYENQAARLRLLPAKRNYGDPTPRADDEEAQMGPLAENDELADEIVDLDKRDLGENVEPTDPLPTAQVMNYEDSLVKFTAKRAQSLENVMKLAIPSLNLQTIGGEKIEEPDDDGISNIGTPPDSPSSGEEIPESVSEGVETQVDATNPEVAAEADATGEDYPDNTSQNEDPIEEVHIEPVNPDYYPRLIFLTYAWVPSPFWLPSFENAIQYSISYVTDRLTQIVNSLLATDVDEEGDEHFYETLRKNLKVSRPMVDEVAQLLSPRPTPLAQEGVVPLTYRNKIEKGTVRSKIKDLEIKRSGSSRNLAVDTPAMKRRNSLTLLTGAFKQKFSNYIAAAENRFDSIKKQDRVNELRPPVDDK